MRAMLSFAKFQLSIFFHKIIFYFSSWMSNFLETILQKIIGLRREREREREREKEREKERESVMWNRFSELVLPEEKASSSLKCRCQMNLLKKQGCQMNLSMKLSCQIVWLKHFLNDLTVRTVVLNHLSLLLLSTTFVTASFDHLLVYFESTYFLSTKWKGVTRQPWQQQPLLPICSHPGLQPPSLFCPPQLKQGPDRPA